MDERPADTSRGDLSKLVAKVREERGLDLAHYRPRYLERRIGTRLRALGLLTYRQYAAYLDANPDEYARLLDALTINVTQFFRDATVYQTLRSDVIPTLLAAKAARKQKTVRVWSAGCATGEEVYSLAISFLAEMRRLRWEPMLLVVGTDIDREALAVARRGVYPIEQLEQIPEPERSRYAVVDGDRFHFRPEVARHVKFEHLNLFEDRPVRLADVVFCRNVFIYFTREQQERMLNVFWESLTRGGYLVLGRSERLAPAFADRFELVSGRERIYRKPPTRQDEPA